MADNKKNLDNLNKGSEKLNQSSKDRIKTLERQNYLISEQLKLQSDSLDLSSSLVDSIKEVLGINTKRSTSDANLLKVNKEINKAILNQEKGLASIDTINKRIAKNEKVIEKGKLQQASLENSLNDQQIKKAKRAAKAYSLSQKASKEIEEMVDLQKEGGKFDEKALEKLYQKEAIAANVAGNMMESLNTSQKQLVFSQLNNDELKSQNEQRKIELGLAKEIEKKLGVAGSLNKLLGAIPGVGKYASDALADVTEELEAAAEAGEKLPSNLKVMGKIVGKTAGNFAKAFGPLALAVAAIGMFVKALKGADKEAGELAKNLGISYKEGLKLSEAARETAREFEGIGSKDVLKAQESLNKYFKTGAKFSSKIAGEFAQIQKRTGLSDKAMGTFAKMAMKSGKPVKSILKDVHATVLEQNQQNKLSLSVKDIQEDIVKVSAAIKLQTKGNVTELTKSVIAAKKLGTTLEQVETISSSLLDFESSIQAELEAELLLGKEINLEKARLFALQGKTGKVAEEIMKNEAVMNAFATDNVIAQEAAAKAIGLSRDQLAEMVMNQKQLGVLQKAFGTDVTSVSDAQAEYNRLKKEGLLTDAQAAILAEEGLANQMESASIAERFGEVMLRIQDIFSAIAEPVLSLVDSMMSLVGGAENFAGILGGILVTYTAIKAANKVLKVFGIAQIGIQSTLAAIAGAKATAEVTAASAMTLGIGALAIGAGVLTVMGIMNSQKQKAKDAGDMISPAKGVTQVSTKEGGLFNLSNNDDLIAAPGVASNSNSNNNISDERMLKYLKDIAKNTNTKLVSTGFGGFFTVEMNGNQVGQGINTAERSIQ